jgi:hypothetical protein
MRGMKWLRFSIAGFLSYTAGFAAAFWLLHAIVMEEATVCLISSHLFFGVAVFLMSVAGVNFAREDATASEHPE